MVELARDALATFLHVSDLHFGPRDPNAPLPGLTPALANRFPGFLGHSGAAIADLERFVEDLTDLELERGFELLVTGDVTACGADDQFVLAHGYLRSKIGPGKPGLFQPAWKDLAIPGNHDHWPGSTWILGPPAALGAHLQPCPIADPPRPLSATASLRFVRIDGDSMVGPYSKERLLALGHFVDQLTLASAALPPRAPGEVRVLLLHHSWHQAGATLRIVAQSRQALAGFLHAGGFSLLLTGHVHGPRVQRFLVGPLAAQRTVVEARCGTTTQKDTLPAPFLLRRLIPTKALEPNTLLVHQIVQTGAALEWRVVTVTRSAASGFRLGAPTTQLAGPFPV